MIEAEYLWDKLKTIKNRPWHGLDVAIVDNHKIRLGMFKGEFGWHKHDNSDEFFLVLKGKITIHLKDGDLVLKNDEYALLPKGTAHNLSSESESFVLVVEMLHLQTERVKQP